jgi:phage shock protein A
MSIRLIAKDLYRAMHAIEALEKKIARTPVSERQTLEAELRRLRAEYVELRRALDGAKG